MLLDMPAYAPGMVMFRLTTSKLNPISHFADKNYAHFWPRLHQPHATPQATMRLHTHRNGYCRPDYRTHRLPGHERDGYDRSSDLETGRTGLRASPGSAAALSGRSRKNARRYKQGRDYSRKRKCCSVCRTEQDWGIGAMLWSLDCNGLQKQLNKLPSL